MAVYRVERTRDYTVMSNYHLRDTNLTLKAKGLLSMMLSLPDQWNYSTRGLASICKEGVDTIGKTIRELEKAGYIVRRQLRGANGRITDTEYVIYEQPQNPDTPPTPDTPDAPTPDQSGAPRAESAPDTRTDEAPPQNHMPMTDTESPRPVHPDTAPSDAEEPDTTLPDTTGPDTAFPHTDFPYVAESDMAEPDTETPAELNIKQSNTKKSITHQAKKDSFFPSAAPEAAEPSVEGRMEIDQKRAEIKAQIEYDLIVDVFNRDQIDEFVEIMLEVAMTRSPTIKIGRDTEYPAAFVQDRFERIDSSHIQRVLEAIEDNTTRVWNTKAYLLATLFNVTSTTGNHYAMLVNHDMRAFRPRM